MRSPYDVIKKPLISEKAMDLVSENKYSFFVEPKSNKIEIKYAIEQLFNVKVLDVRTMNVKGKYKRMGKTAGYRSDRKKAIITLAEGDKIEVFEGV